MSELRDLAQIVHAPGAIDDPIEEGLYLLYPEGSTLSLKHYNAGTWGDEESVDTQPTRPNSSVAALFTPESRSIIYINSSSKLVLVTYDDDDRDWTENAKFPKPKVHAEGKVTAAFDLQGNGLLFYQDPSGSLVQLDVKTFTTSKVPATIRVGSPIAAIAGSSNNLHVFYVSSTDNKIHFVTKESNGNWNDAPLSGVVLSERLRQILVAPNEENGSFEAHILTADSKLYQVTDGDNGAKELIGKVDGEGKYLPTTDAECCCRPRPRAHYCWHCRCCHVHRCHRPYVIIR